MTQLMIGRIERDEDGVKAEPEQQPVIERGRLPLRVSMGVLQEGGPPLETRQNLPTALQGRFAKDTSAGAVAEAVRRRCLNCKRWRKLERNDELVRGIAAKLIVEKYTSDLIRAEEIAAEFGNCTRMHGVSHPNACCDSFRERNSRWDALGAFCRDKYDAIFRAASGKRPKED